MSQDIADNFKCSVCLDIFEAPLELAPCGHIYCFECIRSFFHGSTSSECPECRGRVESSEVKQPNRKLLCLLHNLNIKCEFADRGCNAVVKVDNLIAHSRECRFNKSARRPSAPPLESNNENVMYLLSDESNFIDRIERLHRLATIFALMEQIEESEGDSDGEGSGGSSDDTEFLIFGETFREHLWTWFRRFWILIGMTLLVCVTAVPIAAIVISALKLHSCTQMPFLPYALMALGIFMFPSTVLETARLCCFREKFCIGLKIMQSFAFVSLIYLAVMVYSNLDYTQTVDSNSTLTCDALVFEFSFWYVSALLACISVVAIVTLIVLVCNNLKSIWSEWSGSYILLSFIYSIAIIGMIISISTVTVGSIYFNSCDAIPGLTTKLVVFGAIGVVCWLIMLLSSDYKNDSVRVFGFGLLISFICIAVDVHKNFPWTFYLHALHYNVIDCSTTIYTYSFVIVCVNYVIIGATILMYFIFAGICACLFFR